MPSTSTNAETPTRCAIYLRISQDRNADGLALDRQREDCENLARYRRWDVVKVYVDQSKSATDKTSVRPDYEQMVSDYKAGAFAAIICYDLDRLTRQPRQLEDWIDAAEERGLALVTANGDADLSTDGGRMYARIKAAVARAEMERKAARQKAAHIQRAKQGRPPKGVRPLGFDKAGGHIEHEAVAVEEIFATFLAEHGTLRGVARALSGHPGEHFKSVPALPRHRWTLNEELNASRRKANKKLPKQQQHKITVAPCEADDPWSESTVLEILRNPRYCGYSVYTPTKDRRKARADNLAKQERLASGTATEEDHSRGRRRSWRERIVIDDEGQPVKGQWAAIVDVETWQAVQAKLDDAGRVTNTGSNTRTHMGSGLYLCGVCSLPLRGSSRGYRCRTEGHINRTGSHVDSFVIKVVAGRLAAPDTRTLVPTADSPQLAGVLAELDEHHRRIARAQKHYTEGVIEPHDLQRVREAARDQIERLERQKLDLARTTATAPLLGTDDPADVFVEADLETRRRIIDSLAVIKLHAAPRGRKGFDPASVTVTWR